MNLFFLAFLFLLGLLSMSKVSSQYSPQDNIAPASLKKWNLPKIVWTYFSSGLENAGLFNNKCYRHNLKILNNTGWELRFLTDATLSLYINVTEVNEFMQAGHEVYVQTKSDLIRMLLLRDHGGVWADASIYLFENLSWLQNIHQNPYLQTKFEGMPEVFAFTDSFLDFKRFNYPRKWIENGHLLNPNIQSWFLAALPHSRFFKDWTIAFKTLGTQDIQSTSIELRKNGYELSSFEHLNYFKVYTSKTIVFTDKNNQLNRQYQNGIIKQRKTALEDYKFWTMESAIGPYRYLSMAKFQESKAIFNLFRYDQKDVYSDNFPKYFIKMPGFLNRVIENELKKQQNERQRSIVSNWMPSMSISKCLNDYYLVKNSTIYNILTENGKDELQNLKIKYYEEIPINCRYFTSEDYSIFWDVLIFSSLVLMCLFIKKNFYDASFNQALQQISSNQDTNHFNCKTDEVVQFNYNTYEVVQFTQNKSNLFSQEPSLIRIDLWVYFVDFTIAIIVWTVNLSSSFNCLIQLKYIEKFVYVQFLVNFLLTLLLYKIFSSIFTSNENYTNKKEIWQKRAILLMFIMAENVLFSELKKYYQKPNTSMIPETMIGCVKVTQYNISRCLYIVIYFLLMQDILIERNLSRIFKKICRK